MIGLMSPWKGIAIGAGAIAALAIGGVAVQTARIDGFAFVEGYRPALTRATRQVDAERGAHRQTKANWIAAATAAEQAETARLARVERQQERISDDTARNYASELDALRARYNRLRAQAGTGAAGAADRVAVRGLSAAAGGADAAAGDDRFSLERRLNASEIALQLDALIDWIERQAGVDPN